MNVGATFKAHLRRSDIAARLGGDEFAVLLPQADAAQARTAIGKLVGEVEASAAREDMPMTVSVGLVSHCAALPSLDAMLERADKLMYAAKSRAPGRDRCNAIRSEAAPAPDA